MIFQGLLHELILSLMTWFRSHFFRGGVISRLCWFFVRIFWSLVEFYRKFLRFCWIVTENVRGFVERLLLWLLEVFYLILGLGIPKELILLSSSSPRNWVPKIWFVYSPTGHSGGGFTQPTHHHRFLQGTRAVYFFPPSFDALLDELSASLFQPTDCVFSISIPASLIYNDNEWALNGCCISVIL